MCLSNPLNEEEIRLLLGYNYVEEDENPNLVKYGYETGMTGAAAVNGGMFIMSGLHKS